MPHLLRRVLLHPIMMLVVMITLCRGVKNFYPFNSFPMYADASAEPSDYLIVANAEDGTPLDIKRQAGFSSAKVKKIYTDRLNRATEAIDKDPDEATSQLRKQVFDEMMVQLRAAAVKRRKPLPAKVRITNMRIYQDYQDGTAKFREVPEVIGEG